MEGTPRKTVILTRFPYSSQLGGEELHTVSVAEHYRNNGHKVEFLTSCPVLLSLAKEKKFDRSKMWFYKPPVTMWTLLVFSLLSPFLYIWAFMAVSKIRTTKKNPHFYMLSLGEKLFFTPWCLFMNIPVVWLEHARIGGWYYKNPWKLLYKFLAQQVDVVTVSKMMKKDLGVDSVKVIPNAIDPKVFARLQDVGILPKKLREHLHGNGLKVGYVGRLTEDKGMDLIIEAAKENPDTTFITVGSGPYKKKLEKNGVQNYPYLTHTEVAAFMQSLDIFVLPATKKDPFGLVVLEAMACGIPTILTDVCGVSGSLKSGKECVVSKVDTFQKDLKKLIKDKELREKLASVSSDVVKDRFDFSTMLEEYLKLLSAS